MKRSAGISTLLLLALLALTALAPQARAQDHAQHQAHQSEATPVDDPDVVVHVEGLACQMCARSLTNELKKLDAIEDVEVLLEDDQRVLLTLRDGTTVQEEALREAVTNAGFSTRSVEFAE